MEEKYHEFLTNLTRLFILILINEKPMHGYELMQELTSMLGKKISPGSIYPFLQRLRELGYVDLERSGEARGKKVYKITPEGKELSDKLLIRVGNIISTALDRPSYTCVSCGCKIIDGEYREIINGKELIFCCIHCAKSFKGT